MHRWLVVAVEVVVMATVAEEQQEEEEGQAGRDDTGARGGEKW